MKAANWTKIVTATLVRARRKRATMPHALVMSPSVGDIKKAAGVHREHWG
jgi:hypothetical protein